MVWRKKSFYPVRESGRLFTGEWRVLEWGSRSHVARRQREWQVGGAEHGAQKSGIIQRIAQQQVV